LCLINSLQRLLKTKTKHNAIIWSIYVSHGSALTKIRWGGKWAHLT